MIDPMRLEDGLPVRGIGIPFHYFPSVGSTNDEAKRLAEQGAPHGCLVVADEQTSGRGREGRIWYSKKGSGLALSLILRPEARTAEHSTLTVLGTLAVAQSVEALDLKPKIKWPNDVILEGGKLAGVLVETSWRADDLEYAVIGIGVNILSGSIPRVDLAMPATYLEAHIGDGADREGLIMDILHHFGSWYERLGTPALIEAWYDRLAYLDEVVEVDRGETSVIGRVDGLEEDGRLRLKMKSGETILVTEGDLRLRPIDSDPD